MSKNVFYRLEQFCLLGIILSLPVVVLPQKYIIIGLGGKLSCYFLGIAIFIMLVEKLFYKPINIEKSNIIKYICLSILWSIVCVIVGAIRFPFYEEIDLYQVGKLGKILAILNVTDKQDFFIPIWMLMTSIKNLFRDYFFPFIGMFILIFHLYRENFEKGIRAVTLAIIILVCILGLYSIPELIWLKTDNAFCSEILKTINVYLFDPNFAHGHWPALLQNNQLRSMFPEPSFLGIVAAFIVPFLFDIIYKTGKKIYYLLYFYFSFMIFATNSRTAIIIFLIEILLISFFPFVRRKKKEKFFIISILFIAMLSFVFYSFIFSSSTTEYVNTNVGSVATVNERSNSARYGNTLATLKVGFENPMFGVGYGYKDMYMVDKFPVFARNDHEVKEWTSDLIRQGIFKAGYPILNQYARIFAENGILGLILFLFPIAYIFYILYKKCYLLKNFSIFCLSIALIGQCIAMLSNIFFYSYPLTLSLLFCAINNKEEVNFSQNEYTHREE